MASRCSGRWSSSARSLSTVSGASGRTSSRIGARAIRTALAGFAAAAREARDSAHVAAAEAKRRPPGPDTAWAADVDRRIKMQRAGSYEQAQRIGSLERRVRELEAPDETDDP